MFNARSVCRGEGFDKEKMLQTLFFFSTIVRRSKETIKCDKGILQFSTYLSTLVRMIILLEKSLCTIPIRNYLGGHEFAFSIFFFLFCRDRVSATKFVTEYIPLFQGFWGLRHHHHHFFLSRKTGKKKTRSNVHSTNISLAVC